MNVTLNANYGWISQDFELIAGVIDDTARHVFTQGHCHSLALAIHEATGWDIIGSFNVEDDVPGHVAVRTPDGQILDIMGLHAEDEWAALWAPIDDIDPADAYNAFDNEYRLPEVEKATHWAARVLRAYVPTFHEEVNA